MLAVLNVAAEHLTALGAAVPNPGAGEAPPGAEKFLLLLRWLAWGVGLVLVGAALAAAAKLAIAHRHGGHADPTGLLWVAVGCVVAGSASGIVGALL